jgi:hypothetical protein
MLKRRTDIGPIRSADCRLPTRAARQQLVREITVKNGYHCSLKKKNAFFTVRVVVRWSWLGVTEVMVVHLPLL